MEPRVGRRGSGQITTCLLRLILHLTRGQPRGAVARWGEMLRHMIWGEVVPGGQVSHQWWSHRRWWCYRCRSHRSSGDRRNSESYATSSDGCAMQGTDEQLVCVRITDIGLRIECSCGNTLDRHSHAHKTHVDGMFAQGGKQASIAVRGRSPQSTRQRCRLQREVV
jgi:hypothetical protein